LYHLEEGSKKSIRNRYLRIVVIMADMDFGDYLRSLYHIEEGRKKSSRNRYLKIVVIMADMDFGACI
jgi:hypothetical protein